MKKEDFIKLGLDEEAAEKAAKASKEELEGYIPKSRFDTVNQAKKDAEEQVKTYEKQLTDLQKSVKGNEDLEKQIKDLQEINDKTKKTYESKLKELQKNTAVDLAFGDLPESKRKAAKAFIDYEKLNVDDNGDIQGLKEQVDNLKSSEDASFIFSEDKHKIKGVEPGEGGDDDKGNEPTDLRSALAAKYKK